MVYLEAECEGGGVSDSYHVQVEASTEDALDQLPETADAKGSPMV